MKLWIRSQNKESLSIIKSLCYANHGGKNVVMGGEETTFDIVLGKYPTRERCIEIVDEIQKLLYCDFVTVNSNTTIKDLEKTIKQKGSILHFPKEPLVEYHSASTVVYEMPEN